MRFVDDEYRFSTTRQRVELRNIGTIAIHTVKTFDGDPDSSRPTAGAPPHDLIIDGLQIIVARAGNVGATAAYAIVDACMNPLIVNDEVTALRRRCE
jgi:hypothetical protein